MMQKWTEANGEKWLICTCDYCGDAVDVMKRIDDEDVCFNCFKEEFAEAVIDEKCSLCEEAAEYEFNNQYYCEEHLIDVFEAEFSDSAD